MAISMPAPGRTPIRLPMVALRDQTGTRRRASARPSFSEPMSGRPLTAFPLRLSFQMSTSNSNIAAMPNRPTRSGTKGMPSMRLTLSKV